MDMTRAAPQGQEIVEQEIVMQCGEVEAYSRSGIVFTKQSHNFMNDNNMNVHDTLPKMLHTCVASQSSRSNNTPQHRQCSKCRQFVVLHRAISSVAHSVTHYKYELVHTGRRTDTTPAVSIVVPDVVKGGQ
jgi:hypothetical protein